MSFSIPKALSKNVMTKKRGPRKAATAIAKPKNRHERRAKAAMEKKK